MEAGGSHYEGDLVAYETGEGGNTTKKYTYDDKGRPISFTYSGATYYYIINGHGDVVGLTDASGTKVVSYTYDAFGNLSSIGGGKGLGRANPYRYAGYRYDDETQMYYLISRYYDPMLGRFISKDTEAVDPLEPVTLNLYTYAGNNPVNNVDPDGKAFWSFIKDKAKSFFTIKSIKPKTYSTIAKGIASFAKPAFTAIRSITRSPVTKVSVGNNKKTVKSYGNNKVSVSERGKKPSSVTKKSAKAPRYCRQSIKAQGKLNDYFNKNGVRVHGSRETASTVTSIGLKKSNNNKGKAFLAETIRKGNDASDVYTFAKAMNAKIKGFEINPYTKNGKKYVSIKGKTSAIRSLGLGRNYKQSNPKLDRFLRPGKTAVRSAGKSSLLGSAFAITGDIYEFSPQGSKSDYGWKSKKFKATLTVDVGIASTSAAAGGLSAVIATSIAGAIAGSPVPVAGPIAGAVVGIGFGIYLDTFHREPAINGVERLY